MTISRCRSLGVGCYLPVLSACGVPEGDLPSPGPFLGDWTEAATIGEYEAPDEEVFGSILSVVLMDGGGVVILDGQASRAVGFDDQGRHSFTFGREGPGPGEFVDPSALLRVSDDTLAFLNFSARTLQMFARDAMNAFGEIGRYDLPFWPSDGCSMHGRIFILAGYEDLAVHEVDRKGKILNSLAASDYADEVAKGAPESIAWALRDLAQSGHLVCSEESSQVIHVSRDLGWVRAYGVAGNLSWHSAMPDFVKAVVLPAAGGGVRKNLDPDLNLAHTVVGAAVLADTHLAVSIAVSVPRGEEPEVEGLLALLDLTTGSQTRRDEFAGVVMVGLGERVAVVHREPFPRVVILRRGESMTGRRQGPSRLSGQEEDDV